MGCDCQLLIKENDDDDDSRRLQKLFKSILVLSDVLAI